MGDAAWAGTNLVIRNWKDSVIKRGLTLASDLYLYSDCVYLAV